MPSVQYTPDPAYIAQIEALLKQYDARDPNLFTFDRTTYRSPNFLTPAQLPVARNPNTVVETVWHKTEGHLQGDMSRLLSPSAQVSCHAYLPRSLSENNRTIYMVVDFENEAWQCGVALKADQLGGSFRQYLGWDNENYRSVGNETEASETEGFTPWQMLACVWLQLYLLRKYPNMRADRDHIIGHYQITRQKSDPQLFPWEVFMDAVQNAHTPQPAPVPTPQLALPHFFPETAQTINGAIGTYWLQNGGLPEFGYPVSPELEATLEDGNTYTVQYFERARLEWRPPMTPEQVQRGRVGAELWNELKLKLFASKGGH